MRLFKKESKTDFDARSLPQTRKELFVDIVKNHFLDLFNIGLLLLVFSIPIFGAIIYKDAMYAAIREQFISLLIDETTYKDSLMTVYYIYNAVMVFGFVVFSLGLAGSLRIIRNLCWLKPVFFMHDFLIGIKKNGLYYSIIAFVCGLIHFAIQMSFLIQSEMIIKSIPLGVAIILIFPVLFISFSMIQIYTNKLLSIIRLSFLIFVRSFLIHILFSICFIAVFFIYYIPFVVVVYVVLAVYILAIFPFLLISFHLYNLSRFDKYINKENEKEIYMLGLHQEKDE